MQRLKAIRMSIGCARRLWGDLNEDARSVLKELLACYGFSVPSGDIIWLEGRWYVTHPGLLRIARRKHCAGIHVQAVPEFCDPGSSRWAFKAIVFTGKTCKGFFGYGDADPSNVSSLVRGAEMRVAETRAVNRALRKAYGIGICSVEELGSFSGPLPPATQMRKTAVKTEPASNNGQHPLRDRLCMLIRQHQLDPGLVKAYAADYCEVSELRQASRQQVATFIKHLAEYAQNDRESLLCQLNSYAPKPVSGAVIIQPDPQQDRKAGAA